MFFELHDEQIIGYKHLTAPDLGRKGTSGVTHIGLFNDVLTFLRDGEVCNDSILIHDGRIDILPLYFDRILRKNGRFDSPKIRLGPPGKRSVAREIRIKVRHQAATLDWYLFWFGLRSGQPVFLLFNDKSKVKTDLQAFGIDLRPDVKDRITSDHPGFLQLIDYLERIVNVSGTAYAEELELMVQLGKKRAPTIRRYNFMKAQDRSVKVGREGESLIARYFEHQKHIKAIADYSWMNCESESGLPYDFCVETLDGGCIYLDVKSTDYRFEQKMIFSNQEIAFATEYNEDYFVYRVYCNENGERCLRICADENGLFEEINERTNEYKLDLEEVASVQSVKFAISPCNEAFSITEPIVLSE